MKKVLSIVLTLAMLATMFCAFTVYADTSAGDGISWKISSGTLTLSGKGAMKDFDGIGSSPWYDKRDEITSIVVEEGITSIGDFAFFGCTNAKTAKIASSVEKIGMDAFSYTEGSMTSISKVDAPFLFTANSDKSSVKSGETFHVTISVTGDFKNVSVIQSTLVYDDERISADKDDWCDKAWLETVDADNLGYISNPLHGIVNNTVRMAYISMGGTKIDNKAALYTAGKNEQIFAKVKFKATADISEINTSCFMLKDSKILVNDEKPYQPECSIMQMTSSTRLPIQGLMFITDSKAAIEYANSNKISLNGSQENTENNTKDNNTSKPDTDLPVDPNKPISVFLDGRQLNFDVDPIINNDRTMVPMRAIFESLGAVVEWEPETRSAFGTDGTTLIAFQIDNTNMTKCIANSESETITLDSPAMLVGGRTLVPLRAISESFGCDVDWTAATRTVTITTKK